MIPNKSSFKFEELAGITGVKPYVLRFWETEFPEINPTTSVSGQKIYARKDLEIILMIKKLLFEDKMSIPVARVTISHLHSQNQNSNPQMDSVSSSRSYFDGPEMPPAVNPSWNDLTNRLKSALDFIQEIKIRRNW